MSAAFADPAQWRWPALALCLLVVVLAAAWLSRRRLHSAGVLYRPRMTMTAALAPPQRWTVPIAWLLACVVLDALPEGGASAPRGIASPVAGIAFEALVSLLQLLVFAIAWTLSLRLVRVRITLRHTWFALCWAHVPAVVFIAAGYVALGLDPGLLATHEDGNFPELPGLAAAALLTSAGLAWAVVAWIHLVAVAAGCSRRRIMAVCLAWFVVVVGIAVFPPAGAHA